MIDFTLQNVTPDMLDTSLVQWDEAARRVTLGSGVKIDKRYPFQGVIASSNTAVSVPTATNVQVDTNQIFYDPDGMSTGSGFLIPAKYNGRRVRVTARTQLTATPAGYRLTDIKLNGALMMRGAQHSWVTTVLPAGGEVEFTVATGDLITFHVQHNDPATLTLNTSAAYTIYYLEVLD